MYNLAIALSGLGGRDVEAVTAMEEAVAIRRDLAAADPDRYRPGLADALVILSLLLVDVGRRTESDAATAEASAIRRDLAAAKVERIMRELPSLLKLADELRALDKDAEGVRAETPAEPDASSHAALDKENATPDGLDQGGLEAGEAGRGDVEAVEGTGVADDHGGAAGPGMAPAST
jgi:hypothetical protein